MTIVGEIRSGSLQTSLHRVACLWFFGDFVYAVIPLGVLALITLLLGAPFNDFLQLKEWSFANIVLFGVTIREFIHLKVRVQRTPHSYRLDSGVQFYMLFLISSVLVLAAAVLAEKGVWPHGHEVALGRAQLILILVAVVSSFGSTWTRELAIDRQPPFARNVTLASQFEDMVTELADAELKLSRVADSIETAGVVTTMDVKRAAVERREKDRLSSIARASLARIVAIANEIDQNLNHHSSAVSNSVRI